MKQQQENSKILETWFSLMNAQKLPKYNLVVVVVYFALF